MCDIGELSPDIEIGSSEGVLQTPDSVLMLSVVGATGLSSGMGNESASYSTKTQALKPDANTNLVHQRTLIPVIARDVERDIQAGEVFLHVTRVFAISGTANCNRRVGGSVEERWVDRPVVLLLGSDERDPKEDCIILAL
jgi:hypothetical protein